MTSSWYVTDSAGRYLTVGQIHSRSHMADFVDDPQRKVAEPFAERHHAFDFLAWLYPTGGPYYVRDYAPLGEPFKLHVPDHVPTTAELFQRALIEDRPRFLQRLRKTFEVRNK